MRPRSAARALPMRRAIGPVLLLVLLSPVAGCAAYSPATRVGDTVLSEGNGVINVPSAFSVDETFERLRSRIDQAEPLSVIATVDHAANARSVGLDLPPTRLIVFGNPMLGTQLMQSERTVGIDLPQKFLIWQSAEGQVFITYNDPVFLARRHGIDEALPVLEQISTALHDLARAAATR